MFDKEKREASDPNTSPGRLDELSTCRWRDVRLLVCENPNTPTKTLEAMRDKPRKESDGSKILKGFFLGGAAIENEQADQLVSMKAEMALMKREMKK